jgi:hypothetical protein
LFLPLGYGAEGAREQQTENHKTFHGAVNPDENIFRQLRGCAL